MTFKRAPAKSHNFSLAFEQMCSFVAISDTQSPSDTLKQLILQCFIVLPDEKFHTVSQIKETIDILFGLQITEHDVQECIDQLIKEKAITMSAGTNFNLTPNVRVRLQKRIDEANTLENKVKQEWFDEISKSFPNLPNDQAWSVLRKYLAKAFRRHGIQTAALLDPSIDVAPEYSESLSSLLKETLKDNLPQELHTVVKKAVSGFLANIGSHPERAAYIGQLGDGAFNYFSLTVVPDVAESFRNKLNPLTLFFDTNVLFGLLDLHIHPHAEVSNQLLNAIKKHKFPFTLRYHQATEAEILSTIDWYGSRLRSCTWSTSMSRAAVTSPYLSGIESKYHRLNAEKGMDVETFLKPYAHIDILLKDKGILVHRSNEERLYERATLLNEYMDFFKRKGQDKPYNAIDHDTTVLDAVHQLRSNTSSSLEAGALFITSDYNLFLFDWEMSRKQCRRACTALPNLLFQILRPFIPSDKDFDRSFAETFALSEFRTIGSGASIACSKMLSLLASLKDFPEETAAKLLSNDLLISRLRNVNDDKKFQEIVESAIVSENTLLMEEKAALSKQLEIEKEEKKKGLEAAQIAYEYAELTLKQKEADLKSIEELKDKEKERAELATKETENQRKAKEEAEKRANKEILGKGMAEKKAYIYKIIAASSLSIMLIGIFEFLIYYIKWGWLINHPSSYGLQSAFDILLTLLIFAIFEPKWRKFCWGSSGILFAVIIVILSLLGGPSK
ncbi:MAG TPA: hypothetical protein VII00_04360 [bacterium]